MNKDDLTPIQGTIFNKIFFGFPYYEERDCRKIKENFNILNLVSSFICIKPDYDEYGTLYKEDALTFLQQYVNIRVKYINNDFEEVKVSSQEKKVRMYDCLSKQDGSYIGLPENAWKYIKKYGIEEFYAPTADSKTAAIGFNPLEHKWYGWSHRAIYGFSLGYIVKPGDVCSTSGLTDEYEKTHPEDNYALPVGFQCTTNEDCRKVAIAFARAVS